MKLIVTATAVMLLTVRSREVVIIDEKLRRIIRNLILHNTLLKSHILMVSFLPEC